MRAVYAVFLAGCFSPAPQAGAPCGTNRECPDGLECSPQNTCEKPGSIVDAMPDACPGATCEGDMLVGCGEPIACAHGCTDAHCLQLAPSNGITLDLLDGTLADVAFQDLDFETDDGHISTTDDNDVTTEIRPPGPGVINGIRFESRDGMGIFVANSWTFPASVEDHDATGTNAFVLFARTTINVAAPVDAGGSGTAGGPSATGRNASTTAGGTCRGKAGRSNSGIGAAFGEGGGGGGGAGAGGAGAPSNQANPTGIAGTACSSAPTTIPLNGGNGGGDGGQASADGGGGGGGAMMLVALESITIASPNGAVTAPGAGGLSGTGTAGNGGGGGGGGGAVLLEAPIVDIAGAITANGGGGGAPTGGTDGNRGAIASSSAAAGGTFSCVETPGGTPVTRRGGAGGSRLAAATAGTTCTVQDALMVVTSSQGGGGGGAIGRTHIRRHSGTTTGVQSPTAVVEDVNFQ